MAEERVLVVDDEPDILSILVYHLTREGYRVSTAVTGRSAVVERRGRVQTRRQLLQAAWDTNAQIETRTVDIHVARLRSKLGDPGNMIETVRGVGYRRRGEAEQPL